MPSVGGIYGLESKYVLTMCVLVASIDERIVRFGEGFVMSPLWAW